jgi:TIR domain
MTSDDHFCFFFSYAGADRCEADSGTSDIDSLYEDLCRTVGKLLPEYPAGQIGFFHETCLPAGRPWETNLVSQVLNSKVFVAVVSENYIDASSDCGREFQLFLERWEQIKNNPDTSDYDFLVPVRWDEVDWKKLPQALSQFQVPAGCRAFKDLMVRRSESADDERQYQNAVKKIAEKIVRTAGRNAKTGILLPILNGINALGQVRHAFSVSDAYDQLSTVQLALLWNIVRRDSPTTLSQLTGYLALPPEIIRKLLEGLEAGDFVCSLEPSRDKFQLKIGALKWLNSRHLTSSLSTSV